MKNIHKELVDEKPTTKRKKRSRRNSNGETIEEWDIDVPATKYTYRIYRRCKYCGYEDSYDKDEVEKI